MLPFQVEYAKSSRSKCFVCSQKIDQDSLRMAVMVQAKNFDGKIPQWHHFDCFYKKTTPPDCNLIQGYSDVRWEDQQKIKAKFEGTVASGDKGDKSSTSSSKKTFKLALAGKKKLNCTNCFSEIEPKVFGGIHISFAGTDPKKPNVMHLDCFAVKRDDLQCSVETKKLDGFKDLPVETQNHVTEQLPTAIKRKSKSKDGPSAKQKKLDDKNSELEEKLKEQNNQLWKLRDHLQKMYKKSDWDTLIEDNSLGAPKGIKNTVDQLVDAIYFGTPNRCGECRGRIVPTDCGYKCIGNLTQWTRCMFTTQTPLRSKFRLGAQFSDDAFLKSSCKSIKEKIFPKIPEDKEEAIHVDSALESQRPLDDLNFVVDEGLDLEAAIKSNLEKLGADESKTVNENTAFIIADSNESKSFRIKAAGKKKIHAIKPIHCSRMRAGSVAHIMKNCNIATWDVKV